MIDFRGPILVGLLIAAVGLVVVGWVVRRLAGPVFAHELTVLARRGYQPRLRAGLVVVLLVVLLLTYVAAFGWDAVGGNTPSIDPRSGRFAERFAVTTLAVQLLAVVVLTPAVVGSAITEERDRGTLDLLRTSRLTDREIVVGKLLARLAVVGGVVAAGFPVLALTLFFGGVDPERLLTIYAITAVTAFGLGAVSVYLGTVKDSLRAVLSLTYGGVVLLTLLGSCTWMLPGPGGLSPASLFFVVLARDDPMFRFSLVGQYWWVSAVVFGLVYGGAGLFLVRLAVRDVRTSAVRRTDDPAAERSVRRRFYVNRLGDDADPLVWQEREFGGRRFGGGGPRVACGALVLFVFGAGLFADESETGAIGDGAGDRFFLSTEYLLWWVRPASVPVLATTAAGQSAGFLGSPGTQTLLGPGSFGSSSRNGFRVRAGAWLEDGPVGGIDASYFYLGKQTTTQTVDSAQYPTLARPFFAANLGREFAELVAFPGLSAGRLVAETSGALWGADVNARSCLYRCCDRRAEVFAGYRHLNLREDLSVTEFLTATGPLAPDPVGTAVVVNDTFRTRNQFHGGQVGWAASRRAGRFDLSARASVALGATRQELDITGSQLRTRPGQVTEGFTGGLLAVGPNLGRFSQTRFSAAPEVTLNVGVWLTPGLKAFVGYNALYWTNTLRPGDQIDRSVDLAFVPNFTAGGPAVVNRPLPTFRQADVWAQGVQFGVEARW